MDDVKEVSVEELEALQQKVMEYENILVKNKDAERELADLKEQTAALEAQQTKAAGEVHGR